MEIVFFSEIKRKCQSALNFCAAAKRAVEKYDASGDYNFLDVTNNIRMTEDLIRQENTFFLSKNILIIKLVPERLS